MNLDSAEVQSRRTFIKSGLRNLVLGLFVTTGTVFGLRWAGSDKIKRVNLLPCDSCAKYPACVYGQINFNKHNARVPRIDDCP